MIVSQDGQTIDGIISERDIAYSLADRKGDLPLVFVSALMTRKVVTCSPEDSLSRAAALMHQHRIRHLPVVHEGQLKGLVSMRDILASRVDELEKKSSMALNLVSSAE